MGQVISKGKMSKPAEGNGEAELLKRKKLWLEALTFTDLPLDGREAFIEFAKKKGDQSNISRLDFWFSIPEEKYMEPLLSKYLDDGIDQLPEVLETDDVSKIIKMSSEIETYISVIKNRMRPKITEAFKEFKASLTS